MEDSLKGLLIALTFISVFIIAIFSFIIGFPTEQGVVFTGDQNQTYLQINNANNNFKTATTEQLQSTNNATTTGFNQWDITVGFMGSNAVKQSSSGSALGQFRLIYTAIFTVATEVFKAGSPVLYVLGTFFLLILSVITYYVIKFVRSGN